VSDADAGGATSAALAAWAAEAVPFQRAELQRRWELQACPALAAEAVGLITQPLVRAPGAGLQAPHPSTPSSSSRESSAIPTAPPGVVAVAGREMLAAEEDRDVELLNGLLETYFRHGCAAAGGALGLVCEADGDGTRALYLGLTQSFRISYGYGDSATLEERFAANVSLVCFGQCYGWQLCFGNLALKHSPD